MIGLGTIANAAAVLLGGGLGLLLKNKMKPRFAESVQKAMGLATIFIGAAGAFAGMLKIDGGKLQTGGSMLLIISLIMGTVIGELLKIEQRMETLGEWLKGRFRVKEGGFVDGFVTASLVICVGAMAVVGSLNDGLHGDYSLLLVKSALDFVIIMVFASSLGIGALFSALPLAVYQGLITLFAGLIKDFMSDALIADMSFIGSVLIFAVGINIVFNKVFRVGNMLPGLLIPIIYALLKSAGLF